MTKWKQKRCIFRASALTKKRPLLPSCPVLKDLSSLSYTRYNVSFLFLVYFQVFAIVADSLAATRGMFKCMESAFEGLPHATANPFASNFDRKLYLIPDPPHLLKTTRNCVYNCRGRTETPSRLIHRNVSLFCWITFAMWNPKMLSTYVLTVALGLLPKHYS